MATPNTELAVNPFSKGAAEVAQYQRPDAMVAVEQEREMARIKGMVYMAKQHPRDQKQAYTDIINACQRPSLAEEALYSYARGGTTITGPSIRLAEAIAQLWGNIWPDTEEISNIGGVSRVRTTAWDLQTNTVFTKTFTVPHRRDTRKGAQHLTDARDIYEIVANFSQRRLRACILAVIPRDVIEAAVRECEKTLVANVDTTPERRAAVLKAFSKYGVTREMIEVRIQRNYDSISPAQMVALGTIFTSLKDGVGTAADYFDVPAETAQPKGGSRGDQVAAKLKPAARQPEPEQEADADPDRSAVADEARAALQAEQPDMEDAFADVEEVPANE